MARPARDGATPSFDSFNAKKPPKIGGSQVTPISEPSPPASRLNKTGDQCCNSPIKRKMVSASVITLGTRMSCTTVGCLSEVVSAIASPLLRGLIMRRLSYITTRGGEQSD